MKKDCVNLCLKFWEVGGNHLVVGQYGLTCKSVASAIATRSCWESDKLVEQKRLKDKL